MLLSCFWPTRLIAPPGQKAGDRDVFVQIPPVEAVRTEFTILKLLPACVQQARKPGKRYPKRPPIRQFDIHPAALEADSNGAN